MNQAQIDMLEEIRIIQERSKNKLSEAEIIMIELMKDNDNSYSIACKE